MSALFGRFGSRSYGRYLETRFIPPKRLGNLDAHRSFHESPAELLHACTVAKPTQGCWFFGILPRDYRGGRRDAISAAATLWVDIDAKHVGTKDEAHRLVHTVPGGLRPTFVVDSGNGVHGYWLLNEVVLDIGWVERTNSALSKLCQGDSVYDATRVMRIPGTANTKQADPQPICRVVEYTGSYYSREEIERELPHTDGLGAPVFEPEQLAIAPEPFSLDRRRLGVFYDYIMHGLDADTRGFYVGDRSRLDYAVVHKLLKEGYSEGQIYSIFTDSKYRISEKTLEKRSFRAKSTYIERTIQKALQSY